MHWCALWILLTLSVQQSQEQQQQQLRFLGDPPLRAYASRSTHLGQVLYQVFAVSYDSGIFTNTSTTVTYTILPSLTPASSSSHFSLRPQTGELVLTSLFTSLREHMLEIEAQSDSQSARVTLIVTVVPELDSRARFEQEAYSASVSEGQGIGHAFFVIRAFSLSAVASEEYSIVSSTGGGSFTIHPSNGVLTLTRSLDREEVDSHSLIVRYSFNDEGFVDTSVMISVLDVNDNRPLFEMALYNVSVSESSPVSTSILTLSAADPDLGSNSRVRYLLEDGGSSDFSLDSVSGVLATTSGLDHERTPRYELTVSARDNGSPPANSTTVVVVNVLNIDDECPRFENPLYDAELPASAAVTGQPVLTVLARDPDELGVITYAIVTSGEPATTPFSLDPSTGVLSVADPTGLSGQYLLNISASDAGCLIGDFALVRVRVVASNDHDPEFVTPCNATLAENPLIGTLVATLEATDPDQGLNGHVTYSLLNTSLFSIHPTTGQVRTNQDPSSYDAETRPLLRVGVIARDGGLRQAYCLLTVTLIDANDNSPAFAVGALASLTLPPDTPPQSLVALAVAFDPDSNGNGAISYSLTSPPGMQPPFSVDPDWAEIRTTALLNDSSSASQTHTFTVQATDMGTPSRSSNVTFSVLVAPGAPVFDRPYYNVTICENFPVNKPVLSMHASSAPTYWLVPGADYSSNGEGTLVLTGDTIRPGSVSLVDRERLNSRKSFLFTVEASNAVGRSFTTVEIFVADLDDNSPVVESGFSFNIAEGQPVGLVVTQMLASDADSGTNGEIAYHLAPPSPSSPLFAVSLSGVITSERVFDFEDSGVQNSGILRVELYNPNPINANSTQELSAFCDYDVFLSSTSRTVEVAWSVVDRNDNPPLFGRSLYVISLPEDEPVQTSVFDFGSVATDMDQNDQGRLAFAITRGNSDVTFVVEGHFLVLVRGLDHETTPTYNLTLEVSDGVHSDFTRINITVSDVDDEPPVFQNSTYQAELVEMSPPGTSVLTVSAHDMDTPTIHYWLSGPALDGLSMSSDGVIYVSEPLDREQFPNGILTFLVFAEGGGVASAQVELTLLDVNDHAPRFLEVFSGSIPENTPPGEGVVIARVTARDPDQGRNGTVTYSLLNGNGSGFEIDSSSGLITAHQVFDTEQDSTHFLLVSASDDGDPAPLSSTSQVRVEILDENDNPPSLTFPFMLARIFEGLPIGSHVLDIPVSDPDQTISANFTLVSATPPGLYELDPRTGEVTVAVSLDYEVPLHRSAELRVMVRDSLFPEELPEEGVVSLQLLDRNDNIPHIQMPVIYNSILGNPPTIPETLPPGQVLASLVASDEDEGSNGELVYSIVSGDDRGDFSVSQTGQVTSTRLLDYETATRYSLRVRVSDRGLPPLYKEVVLEFNVQDSNDNPPRFTQDAYRLNIPENQPPMESLLRVEATDPDTDIGGEVGEYAILEGEFDGFFFINSSTGVLGSSVMFDREVRDTYTLIVTASDEGAASQTGSATIEVSITDLNDNPSLDGGLLLVYIHTAEGLTSPGVIGQVFFQDPDVGDTFQDCNLRPNNFFNLFSVASDCSLSVLRDVVPGTYSLTVSGRDGVHTTVESNILITVDQLDSETLTEEGVVTLTLNATAEVYYGRGLNVSLPARFARHLGVEERDVNVISLQPGYHDPLNTLDMTLSVSLRSGEPALQVLNLLYQAREQLFEGGYGVVALPTDPCVSEPCSNQARCSAHRTIGPTQPVLSFAQYILVAPEVTLGYTCDCAPGTSGETCEINFDDCYSDPCLKGAPCTDGVRGFICDCPEGTSGEDCSIDPDECTSNPCLNDARCVNGPDTYICNCLPGFYGPECQYAHFQPSSACDSAPCQNGATCSPGRDGYTCLCPPGFDSTHCESEVQLQGGCVGNPCHNGSSCVVDVDGGGEGQCQCSVGFTGPRCRWPLDACELEPCQNGATCESGLYGSALCTCPPGFAGETCSRQVPACEVADPCLNGGRCRDEPSGAFVCECPRNFTGVRCEVIISPPDLCPTANPPCSTFSNCTSGAEGVTCSCLEGYGGPTCSLPAPPPSPCGSNPCLHGGTCQPAGQDDYVCVCSRGFTGDNCQLNLDDCASEPCLNGGTCLDGIGGFVCECRRGVTGEFCQVYCPEGWGGQFCQDSLFSPACFSSPCGQEGTCEETTIEEGEGGFVCLCPPTRTGPTCDLLADCTSTLCLNGGTCLDQKGGGAECQCPLGFDGTRCELLTATFTGSSMESSFRAYSPLRLQGGGRLSLEFATRAQDGLLLFSTQYQEGTSRDWLMLEVVGGRLRVGLALGSGGGSVVLSGGSSVLVSDGVWHQVSVETAGKVSDFIAMQGLWALYVGKQRKVTPLCGC